MLAPLKNRGVLERDLADPQSDLAPPPTGETRQIERMASEISSLRQALRQSRQAQRKSATAAARQIVSQLNEINRLRALNTIQKQRLAEFESGRTIIELGQKLIQLSEDNRQLGNTVQRVWFLEKTIAAAHTEYERLSQERDRLLAQTQGDSFAA
jgi:hypothetical protein